MPLKGKAVFLLIVFFASAGVFALTGSAAAMPAESLPEPSAEKPPATVTAYYFHGNRRCASCKKIEQFSREAVEEHFKKQLEAGTL